MGFVAHELAQDRAEPRLETRIDARGGRGDATSAARHDRVLDDLPGALALGGREILAHYRGILRMQMHAHLARGDGQRGNSLADDADDVSGVGLELAPHDLAR